MKGQVKTYYSYGNIFKSTAEIFYPKSTKELQQIIAFCKENNRKITVAGTFNSFDQQNGSNDVVISLKEFNSISFCKKTNTVEVGAGAIWGDIFDVVYANKCAFYTCITGTTPSAGGTLAVHTNSIWTPSAGKEGCYCLKFDIMTTDGTIKTCSREQNSDLFYGAISSLGFLGFILKITYEVLYVGKHYILETNAIDYDNIKSLEKRLYQNKVDKETTTLENLKAKYSLFYVDSNNEPKLSIYHSVYTKVAQKKKNSTYNFAWATLSIGILRSFPRLTNLVLKMDVSRPSSKRYLLKTLNAGIKSAIFWAQPDYFWTKKISKYLSIFGYKDKLYQHSYFIPEGDEKITFFTEKLFKLMQQYKLYLFMSDISYAPKDEPFVLSPTRYTGGYYINTTFVNKTNKKDLFLFYEELNTLALKLGGSLNLIKNCFIKPTLLEQMYQPQLEELALLKKKYDPKQLITSNFFESYFPSYFSIKKTKEAPLKKNNLSLFANKVRLKSSL